MKKNIVFLYIIVTVLMMVSCQYKINNLNNQLLSKQSDENLGGSKTLGIYPKLQHSFGTILTLKRE